ncbi:MAG: hypothetical protein QOE70_1025 [Chthoniobacter sp.]|nr:hypothetical protein [Chthoniobacter sp.]
MNIAARLPLSRRTFLRAAGATLALPFLESMMPRLGHAAAASEPPRRFVGMMTNMGILPDFFFPKNDGRDYEPSPYLDLLQEHRADLTVFSGVSLPGVDGGHAAERSFLTGAPGASRGSFRNSVSLDQVMAEKLGSATRFPALPVMIGSEYLSLSWTRSGSMIPPIVSPLKLYQQLFVEDTPAAKADAVRRLQQDRSLLDGLRAQFRKLQQSVNATDRDRLEQFATAVRDLEKSLAATEGWVDRPKPKVSAEQPKEIEDRDDLAFNSRVMLDLVRLALETDSTRIVTVCFNTGSLTAKKIPGVKSPTHPLTHHGQQPEKVEELRCIEEAQFRALAEFLTGLKASQEQGTPLLDRTACLYGTNMGSANAHSNDNLPVLLAGGGFKHAGHLAFDKKNNYPLSNLFVSLLQRLGLESDRFASSTGTMRGLELS